MELAINDLPGEGRPLVILHGLLGSGRNWLGPARKLNGSGRRVVMADMRNHGQSPWGRPMTYEAMADDVIELIGRLGAGPVDLLGHSMGGKAAMNLALRQPELLARLILVDIAPVAYSHRSFADYIEAMRAVDLAAIQRRGDADTLLATSIDDVGMRGFLLQNLESDHHHGFRWRVDLELLANSLPELVGWSEPAGVRPYPGPALALRGALSSYVREESLPEFRRLFPKLKVVPIPEAAHWPHVEAPEPFFAALVSFLQGPA
ncbi:MAG TPA: alpha/beta fold hydrolase [Geminicoccus sp.]|jgi:pimeloyl-ACP methyl ester carboxylesterase|uniref:alpha/beta fold hydrolase n=1 Tax=Geminicoccus sp. TaxID=2024832 RepID=UPI002E2F7528|nr:alpha/beta fold hydrolase [Geminicoccus sp.]HEX2528413.1 alpha/beta fold hydrolase [Geminicoccus sp.]